MNYIQSFFQDYSHKVSLPVLLSTHSRLSAMQLKKNYIQLDDLYQTFTESFLSINNDQPTNEDVNFYISLLIDSCLTLFNSGLYQMLRDLISNETLFLKNVIGILYSYVKGQEYPAIEDFKIDASRYLTSVLSKHQQPSFSQGFSNNQIIPPAPPLVVKNSASSLVVSGPENDSNYFSNNAGYPRPQLPNSQMPGIPNGSVFNQPRSVSMNPSMAVPTSTTGIDVEKTEPMIRFLAQIRKIGSDILFPQSIHDKVLVCIFVAVKTAKNPPHRELIEMIMAARDSKILSAIENVSKTKIRGVLALLKHGEMLLTQGIEGEPVRLSLAPGIDTFKELRERHDAFLHRYIIEHHLFVPTVLKSEIIWQFEEDVKAKRIEIINQMVTKLEAYLSGFTPLLIRPNNSGDSNDLNELDNGISSIALEPAEGKSMFSPNQIYSSFSPSLPTRALEKPYFTESDNQFKSTLGPTRGVVISGPQNTFQSGVNSNVPKRSQGVMNPARSFLRSQQEENYGMIPNNSFDVTRNNNRNNLSAPAQTSLYASSGRFMTRSSNTNNYAYSPEIYTREINVPNNMFGGYNAGSNMNPRHPGNYSNPMYPAQPKSAQSSPSPTMNERVLDRVPKFAEFSPSPNSNYRSMPTKLPFSNSSDNFVGNFQNMNLSNPMNLGPRGLNSFSSDKSSYRSESNFDPMPLSSRSNISSEWSTLSNPSTGFFPSEAPSIFSNSDVNDFMKPHSDLDQFLVSSSDDQLPRNASMNSLGNYANRSSRFSLDDIISDKTSTLIQEESHNLVE